MNNNSFGLNEAQIENLLEQVSANMGIDKEDLRYRLQSGQMDDLLGQSGDPRRAQIMKMMQNKELMDKFLASDEAVDYLKKISEEL